MAANFTNFVRILGTLGGEDKKMEAERTLANVTTVVADVTKVLTAAAVGSPTTLWTADSHDGTAASEFSLLAFVCDPDNLLTTDQQIDLELAFTDANGDVTTRTFLCNKSVPFLIGNSVVRGAITTSRVLTEHITRVRVLNFTGNSTETVRLLLLRV